MTGADVNGMQLWTNVQLLYFISLVNAERVE